MATSKSFFLRRSGSTKSHTFQKRAGMQITQDVRVGVSNPRTLSQMEHRCLIHTMADAHTWLSPLFGNLWEDAKGAAAYMAKFREANFTLLKLAAFGGQAGWTFSPYKETTHPLGYFKVASGSLPYKGGFFHNALLADNAVTIDLFNYSMNNKVWGDVLKESGLNVGDTLRLYILLWNTETQRGHVSLADIQLIGDPAQVIGTQLASDIASVSFKRGSYAWVIQDNGIRGFSLYYQDASIDWEHTVVMTMCVQVRRVGGRTLNSDGYLWHYYEHLAGLHFREAVETYPNAGGEDLAIPEPDEDLYVDLGLPSGLLWSTRNVDATKKNGFAESKINTFCSYFSWGNVDPHNKTGNTSFSPWSWGGAVDGEPYKSTPGAEIHYGTNIDDKHDAARVFCGEGWIMPYKANFDELFANCEFIDAQSNPIPESQANKLVTLPSDRGTGSLKCLYLRSKVNGNKIIFPCTGHGNGSSITGNNNYVVLPTRQLRNNTQCICFYAYSGGYSTGRNMERYYGFAIRPVLLASKGRKSDPDEKEPPKKGDTVE